MARVTQEHMLEIGAVTAAVGVVLMVLSYAYRFMDAPGWLGFYESALDAIPGATAAGYNLWVMILSTILAITGAFYFGEQMMLRRRFERIISTAKKSEFASRRKDLDDLVRRLPATYKDRVKAKETSFRSIR